MQTALEPLVSDWREEGVLVIASEFQESQARGGVLAVIGGKKSRGVSHARSGKGLL